MTYYSQLHICKTHTRRKSDRLNAADCLSFVTCNGSLVRRTVVDLNAAKLKHLTFSLLRFALSTVWKEHCYFKVPRLRPFVLLVSVKVDKDESEFYIHVTVCRYRFIFNNQPDALFIKIYCHKTLLVSGNFFAHHQESPTVHSALVSFMQVMMTASKQRKRKRILGGARRNSGKV